MSNEADTCQKYVLPRLLAAGWDTDLILEQKTFTDGRIVVSGSKVQRRDPKRADYLLRYTRDFTIAVVDQSGLQVGNRWPPAGQGIRRNSRPEIHLCHQREGDHRI
jgi:hypothetical protein